MLTAALPLRSSCNFSILPSWAPPQGLVTAFLSSPRRQPAFRHLGLIPTWAPWGLPSPSGPAVSEAFFPCLAFTFPVVPEGSSLVSAVSLPAYNGPVNSWRAGTSLLCSQLWPWDPERHQGHSRCSGPFDGWVNESMPAQCLQNPSMSRGSQRM